MNGRHAINLSAAWLPPDPAAGRSGWLRRFGMPAGIEPHDRVWLVVESPAGCSVALAGGPFTAVPPGAPHREEITAALRQRNELHLVTGAGPEPAAVVAAHGRTDLPIAIGRVWLEIEAAGGGGAPAAEPA